MLNGDQDHEKSSGTSSVTRHGRGGLWQVRAIWQHISTSEFDVPVIEVSGLLWYVCFSQDSMNAKIKLTLVVIDSFQET